MGVLDEYVGLRGDHLLRFCCALTADEARARAIAEAAAQAASSRAVRRGDLGADAAVWRAAVDAFVRSSADRSAAQARAAQALRDVEGLDATDIAALLGRRVRWVRRRLAEPVSAVAGDSPPRHSGHRRRALVLLAAAVLLAAGTAGVLRWQAADGKPVRETSRPANAVGLLPWAPRGPLGLEHALHVAATAVWHKVDPRVGTTSVLWGGTASGGRMVILEAIVGGAPEVAIIGDDHGVLRATGTWPLESTARALVVDYPGPEPAPPGVDGASVRILRLLVAPGVDVVERRGAALVPAADVLPGAELGSWEHVDIRDGLTAPWVDLSATLAFTAVRLGLDNRTAALVPAGPGVLLTPLHVHAPAGPRGAFADQVTDASLADAGVAAAQLLRADSLGFRLVYGGDSYGPLYLAAPDEQSDCSGALCVDGAFLRVRASDSTISSPQSHVTITAVPGFLTPKGSILLTEGGAVELLGPPGSAGCAFGSVPPRVVTSLDGIADPEAQASAQIEGAKFDGAFVCVDAHGKVLDRSVRYSSDGTAG
jgi:hypothetical protein